MPYRVVDGEYCGKWWHYWWAGPVTYIHAVDIPDLPEGYCEVAQPYNLLGTRKGSTPVACVPLVYRGSEGVWVFQGKSYTRLDSLISTLERAVETWPHWCRWAPVGPLPPSILDVELLEEALRKMPVLVPAPEELAADFVAWSYGRDVAAFLHSEYVHLTSSSRKEERWREICEHDDPRVCYPGAVGEVLADIKARGEVPAVDSVLFGRRFARPWGQTPVAHRTERGWTRIYYVLGHLLRETLPRVQALKEQSEWEIPRLDLAPLDVQGLLLREARRRRPGPLTPIESYFFPTSDSQEERGDPFAAFYTDL